MKINGKEIAIFVVLVLILAVGTGYIKLPSTTASIGSSSSSLSSSSAACTNVAAGYPKLQLVAGYLAQNNGNKFTQAAVVTNVTIAGEIAPVSQVSTSATAAAFVNGTVPCGSVGTVYLGDSTGTGYYTYPVSFSMGSGITQVQTQSLPKMAQLSGATISNATNFGTGIASGVTAGKVVSAGGTAGPFVLTLTTGQGQLGENGTAITLVYNGVAVQSVSMVGPNGQVLPTISYTIPGAANVITGYTSKTFLAPPMTTWNTNYQYQISVQTSSAFAANTGIGIMVQNQQLWYNNGATTVQVVNPITSANLGEPPLDYGTANAPGTGGTNTYGFGQNSILPNPIALCFAAGCT